MYNKLRKSFLIAQALFSVALVAFCIACTLRGLYAGQLFCALFFALAGCLSAHLLLLPSLRELRAAGAK